MSQQTTGLIFSGVLATFMFWFSKIFTKVSNSAEMSTNIDVTIVEQNFMANSK
ncbi:hypothetical protein [cyanobacterium endosymbiont of Epithemia clementina EcSB]|uniref:hypothetical protein n=1 Tax=cyanobacterium endosymbiont of Epithemia clementina EcSB TaxID=3034674 RepID=UPI0024807081|nr:hypothetical protein [cyanobacterium endosymbiont of Epithemia clementina EcSB]WGT67287.1 hypothetical protein P3F56_08775 [cyanobacterium endosymbiont of Epithemia clementina EcSB]